MEQLTTAARSIKVAPEGTFPKDLPKKERLHVLREVLFRTEFPEGGFGLPLNPEWMCKGLKVEKCKFMDSKKLPLWLVFENMDPLGKDLYVIFKDGDDLRQDMLTLQMFKIMDDLWRRANLDLLMIPYGCISTGDEIGFIEVVMDSDTTANITADMGTKGARSVWQEDVFEKWLVGHNSNARDMDEAVQRFMHSCAGYCVATYALGIGDRHNDNVMLKKNGNLFHIDFGHFLGNYKAKFGIKREKAPFIFTPAFAHVLGGMKVHPLSLGGARGL
jgi:phosphatidylinositol-4,5-bisphosphate 3-kinase